MPGRGGFGWAAAAAATVALGVSALAAPAATNIITTVAGNGAVGFSGDGGPATAAQLSVPIDVAPTSDGGFLIADEGNDRVRKVAADGTISTVAGNGQDIDGGNGPATSTAIKMPLSVAPTSDGGFLVADYAAHKIRKVDAQGNMTTIAGNGVQGFSGDGGAATSAQLNSPARAVPSSDGGILIVDQQNHRIRKIDASGTITTVAGNGAAGFGGDGGAAASAQIHTPEGIAALGDGGFLIADTQNHRIRRVNAQGVITTVAGNGTAGAFGDGVVATNANLNSPADVAVAPSGAFVIADNFSQQIRVVGTDGIIRRLAGTGDRGFAGDGGPATSAQFSEPYGVGVDIGGDVFVADHTNNRIRRIDADLVPIALPSPPPAPPGPPGPSNLSCTNVINGTNGRNVLRGTIAGDRISGRRGRDRLYGRDGNDCLFGNDGRDYLSGANGDDELSGGTGADHLVGGRGTDLLVGSSGNDRLQDNSGSRDTLSGGSGNDRISSVDGNRDTVQCGAGRRDRATVDRVDRVRGCERVTRVGRR